MVFGMPWSNALFHLGLYGFICCFFLSGKWNEKLTQAFGSKIFLSSTALTFITIISLGYTIAPLDLALIDVARYCKLLMVGILMFVFDSERKRLSILFAIAAGITTLMLPTILDGTGVAAYLNLPLKQFANQGYTTDYSGKGLANLVYWRNHIAHGFFVSLLFFICLCSAIEWKRYRIWFAGLALISLVDIVFFIYGRMALLSLAASLIFFSFIQLRSFRWRAVGLGGILVLFFISYFSINAVRQRVDSVFSETQAYSEKSDASTSAGHRLHYWKISLQMFNHSKFLGEGAGSFRRTLEITQDQFLNENHSHTHNEYLTALSQYGLLGFGAILYIFFLAFNDAQNIENPMERKCYAAIIFIFSLNCLTDSMLYNQDEGWTLVFVLALIAAAIHEKTAKCSSAKNSLLLEPRPN